MLHGSCLSILVYISNRKLETIHMSFEESETEESATSLSEVSSLDDEFVRMDPNPQASDEEVTEDEIASAKLLTLWFEQ